MNWNDRLFRNFEESCQGTLVPEGNVKMFKINEQTWLYVMKTITYRRYYNKNIERNLESDNLGDLELLFTNMCYFQRTMEI